MKYITSALFFAIWAYLSLIPGTWYLVPFGLGTYLLVIAERERLRAEHLQELEKKDADALSRSASSRG